MIRVDSGSLVPKTLLAAPVALCILLGGIVGCSFEAPRPEDQVNLHEAEKRFKDSDTDADAP